MSQIYVLEYNELDSLNRQKGSSYYGGVFTTLEELEVAKERILSNTSEKINFTVYPTQPSTFPFLRS